MSTSYRKKVKAGPVNINLSKSGIGFSTGVKGLRVGVNGKGKSYISAGKNGIRYNKSGCAGGLLLLIILTGTICYLI